MAILLVHNLEHFIFPVYPADSPGWLNALDQGVFNVVFTLFAGKAYAIFALLFGFTFYIQCNNQKKQGKDFGYFLLPGGTPISAQLQFARTVARRAERRLWTLHRQDPVNEDILRFINRLSDLFFVMARMEMQRQDWPEEKWQEFAYKRKRQ